MPKTLVRTDPSVTIGLEIDCVRYVTVVGHETDGALSVWTWNIKIVL